MNLFVKVSTDNHLIIFIKNPVSGTAKTRLAQSIGDEQALWVYQKLLDKTRKVSIQIEATKHLFYATFIDQNDEWPDSLFYKQMQKGEDLGQKMFHAFNRVLKQGEKAVIIGSDCYDISAEIINRAFDQLNHYDVVVGPARDGGYYLLGLKESMPSLFEGILWSTNQVLDQTINAIRTLNKQYVLLEELNDIDTLQDLKSSGLNWIVNDTQNTD